MKKYKIIREIIGFLCFLLLTASLLHGLNRVFTPKWGENDAMQTYMMRGFYSEKKNSLQVLAIGDSDVYRGVSPIAIFQDSGITSYTLASSSQRMWQSYYTLKHALKYQKPEVVLLEVNASRYNEGREIAMMHQYFDNMKLDEVKWEALQDPVFAFTTQQKLNLLFPVLQFHSRYNELKEEDFTLAFGDLHFPEKGLAMKAEVKPYTGTMNYMQERLKKPYAITPKTMKYMEKIADLCHEEGITLVLFKTPEPKSWRQPHHDAVAHFAKQHDLTFIDYNDEDQIVHFDMQKDTMDKGTHLNVHGSEKLSTLLSRYLRNKLHVKPYDDKEVIAVFRKDAETYQKDKAKAIAALKK